MKTRKAKNTNSPIGVLYVTANPINASRLAFDRECAAIERELRMAEARNDFDFRSRWAVTAHEMMRHLNELQPTVLHVSCHAGSGGAGYSAIASRGIANCVRNDNVLYLQDEHGNPQYITAQALRRMIRTAATSVRVVVLNACHSGQQASVLRTAVDCVVGMKGAIRDEAALSFAVGFYGALGNRCSIANAVEQAIAILEVTQPPDARFPCYMTRRGINANEIFLSGARTA